MNDIRLRRARRMGTLAQLDHLLRAAPRPANPYRPGTKGHDWFQFGIEQAQAFAAPLRDRASASGQRQESHP